MKRKVLTTKEIEEKKKLEGYNVGKKLYKEHERLMKSLENK